MGFMEFFVATLAVEDGSSIFNQKKINDAYIRKNKFGEYEIVVIKDRREYILSTTRNKMVAEDVLNWAKKQ